MQSELREKEETIRALLDARTDSALLLDLEGRILAANETAAARIGLSPEKLQGTCVYRYFDRATAEWRRQKVKEVLDSGRPVRFEDERGGLIFDNNIVPLVTTDGRIARVAVFAADVTERRRAEEALRASELKYRTLVTMMKEGLMAVDDNDVIQYVNPRTCELLGYGPHEMVGRGVVTFVADDEGRALLEEKKHLRTRGVSDTYELAMQTRAGRKIYVQVSGTPVVDDDGRLVGSLGVLMDVTERKRSEEKIRAALTEKTVLLKEVHHRVKNNLQVISSLLSLQSSQIEDAKTRDLFKESQSRIRSMSLVHEKLYQSGDLSSIDCGEYLNSLAVILFRSYGGESRGIRLNVETNGIHFGVDAAIPCGLIVNELVTNSLKYAFPHLGNPGAAGGEVSIFLDRPAEDTIRLRVEDDGVGLPAHLDLRATRSLGLQLVQILSEQLGGTLAVEGKTGARFTITFPS